ncbi:MAG: 3-oxo-5a-steroid 4- dehydrogenase [Tremellales sp. Tagirdzhanova-0007]|nr:MAG: 3-oxo-5a-steroid 4- dehydrogenase [Tremellales sp. Tagirdzhanova-0007]
MVSLFLSYGARPASILEFPDKNSDSVTVAELKSAIHAEFPTLVPNRQRVNLPVSDGKVPLIDDKRSLGSYGVGEGSNLMVKDLGRQVNYRALYLWEYAGPIFLNPLLLYLSHFLWGEYQPSALQMYAKLYFTVRNIVVLHFIKRFLESAYIHHFSRASLPLSYVFRNCLYYWGQCGLLMGLTLYRPANSAQALKGTIF